MKFVFSSIQRAEPTSDKSREDKNLEQHPRDGDDDKQAEMPLLESVPKTKIKQPKKKKVIYFFDAYLQCKLMTRLNTAVMYIVRRIMMADRFT